jgi:hypothetical protein
MAAECAAVALKTPDPVMQRICREMGDRWSDLAIRAEAIDALLAANNAE